MQDVPPEQEEQVISMMKMTTGPAAMGIFTLLGNILLGLVIGLLGGLFAQKAEQ